MVRTWFYLDDLLAWYDTFNETRTGFFKSRDVLSHLIPASTGIGAANPAGKALTAAALAIKPRNESFLIREVSSPLQCSATAYRSSFSRAVELECRGQRTLLISGTASIAPDGRTVHSEDVAKQIDVTLDVVEAILKSRGMKWANATRAIGYFRDLSNLPIFDDCCRKRGMAQVPLTRVPGTICRPDLLFEMELDAVVGKS